jgi:hypothetical protein
MGRLEPVCAGGEGEVGHAGRPSRQAVRTVGSAPAGGEYSGRQSRTAPRAGYGVEGADHHFVRLHVENKVESVTRERWRPGCAGASLCNGAKDMSGS